MNILHISDIHFRRTYEACEEGYKGMLASMQSPLIPLAQCLERVQQQTVLDIVIISGDLTEDGEAEDYRFFKEWLYEALGNTDVIVTLGNHDIKRHFRSGWCEEEASDLPYNQVVDYPDFTVLAFDNSCYGQADGCVNEEQFQWLEMTLNKLKDRPIILVTHHHLLSQQSATPKWSGTDRFLELVAPYDIRCILNGHTHHPFIGRINGIPYYTVAGMSFIGEDEGAGIVRFEEGYGYNLYHFKQGEMTRQLSENFKPGHVLKTLDLSV
ncbi:metallophosphoesterase [Enterococcus sp. BWT-B8]|uniref:metallophosphoesterase family protein n=1 Tax=Enterococcus sp. BWT-B8 TaxID=2885157 RepID=UPI001E3570AE|nr:metallophosphoesterase [Enterococcus sp. BWT-B8]MCB5951462.1 metallophosphoesterase [Enterococcus sp. BWT-B8]